MSNARIQFSLASEDVWNAYNPQLKEGEIVTVLKANKKVKLVQGKVGGSNYSDSTVVWDQDLAEQLLANTEAAAATATAQAAAASGSASKAAASESAALASASNAKVSETAAKTSETNAKASENAAKSSATSAASSASTASTQAGKAADSATAAAGSAAQAGTFATTATNKATAADKSATAAQTAAVTANTKANEASDSATNAANSASAALVAQNAAKSSQEAAKQSENNAAATLISAIKSVNGISPTDSTGKITVPTIFTYDTDLNNIDRIPAHRRYRGKYLGTSFTAEQSAHVKDWSFEDLYVGDCWTINGVKWRIADICYYINCGDQNDGCQTPHLVIVPDTALYNQRMNTSNVTTGAYIGSEMYKSGLNAAKTTIANAFSGHLLTIRHLFSNSVNGNVATGFEWVDATVWLMNEVAVYGTYCHTTWYNSDSGTNKWPSDKYSTDNTQYAMFAQNPRLIHTRQTYWLRNVVDSTYFADVYGNGSSGTDYASYALGVRPAFCIS